jgi:hypothetical protein
MTTLIISTLSMAGALLVMGSYFIFPDCRTLPRRLVCFLAITDFGQGMFFWLSGLNSLNNTNLDHVNCQFLTPMGIFFANAMVYWNLCIAYYINRFMRFPDQKPDYMLDYFHAICWGFPMIYCFCLATFASTYFGIAYPMPWCFMEDDNKNTSAKFFLWNISAITIPVLISWTITFLLYFDSQRRVARLAQLASVSGQPSIAHTAEINEVRRKLVLVPLAFLCLRAPDAIYRAFQINNSQLSTIGQPWLQIIVCIGVSGMGIFNCFVFVFLTQKVRQRYAELILRCFCPGHSAEHPQSRASSEGAGTRATDRYLSNFLFPRCRSQSSHR